MNDMLIVVNITCSPPKPRTYFFIDMRRPKVSSNPIAKSKKTIPSSAIDFVVSVLVNIPKPKGPIAAPDTKYPRAGLKPSCLKIIIIATEASNKTRISLR